MYLSHDAANEVTVTGIILRSLSMSRNIYIFILLFKLKTLSMILSLS